MIKQYGFPQATSAENPFSFGQSITACLLELHNGGFTILVAVVGCSVHNDDT
jgi:hypothetical protein